MRRRSAGARLLAALPLFVALGHEARLAMVARLSEEGPLSIAELTRGTDLTRQAVTKHLVALEEAGLLRSSRLGRQRIWELVPRRLDEAQRHLQSISEQWDRAIDRLRVHVED